MCHIKQEIQVISGQAKHIAKLADEIRNGDQDDTFYNAYGYNPDRGGMICCGEHETVAKAVDACCMWEPWRVEDDEGNIVAMS